MTNPLILEISNGLIILITSLILWGVRSVIKWIKSVNDRLDRIEQGMNKVNPTESEK